MNLCASTKIYFGTIRTYFLKVKLGLLLQLAMPSELYCELASLCDFFVFCNTLGNGDGDVDI